MGQCIHCNKYTHEDFHPECKPTEESQRMRNDAIELGYKSIPMTAIDNGISRQMYCTIMMSALNLVIKTLRSRRFTDAYDVTESEINSLVEQFTLAKNNVRKQKGEN